MLKLFSKSINFNRSFRSVIVSINVPKSFSSKIDYTKVPDLLEKELQESYMKGSGPGGQSVNKTENCVLLKHLPTGLWVKCHDHRSLYDNKKLARKRLQQKLDDFYNGDKSVSAQKEEILTQKSLKKNSKARKLREMKKVFKQRENID